MENNESFVIEIWHVNTILKLPPPSKWEGRGEFTMSLN